MNGICCQQHFKFDFSPSGHEIFIHNSKMSVLNTVQHGPPWILNPRNCSKIKWSQWENTFFLCSNWICRCVLHHFGCSAVTSYSVEEQSLKKVSLTQCLVSWLGKAVTVWVQQHVSVAHSSEFKPNPSTTCHQTWYSYHRPDIRFLSTH